MPMLTTARIGRPVNPCHAPLRTPIGESGHPIEHGMDAGHDIRAVDENAGFARRAQGGVQNGAVLGGVDPIAAVHGVDPLAQPALFGEIQQQPERLVGDPVFREIQEPAGGLAGEALAAARVLGEQRPQVRILDPSVMFHERPPGRPVRHRFVLDHDELPPAVADPQP